MKKRLLVTSMVLLSLTLAACSNKEKETTGDTTVESSKAVETEASISENETATFKGKIGEIPVLDEETVSLHFASVEAIEDPDKLIDTLNASGVTLMADVESLKDFKPEDLEVGDELEFVINTPAQMTFSIPPQISGSSILSIKPLN